MRVNGGWLCEREKRLADNGKCFPGACLANGGSLKDGWLGVAGKDKLANDGQRFPCAGNFVYRGSLVKSGSLKERG